MPCPDHFIVFTLVIMSVTFCPFSDPDVLVCDADVLVCVAASLFCACLVSAHASALQAVCHSWQHTGVTQYLQADGKVACDWCSYYRANAGVVLSLSFTRQGCS